ncbi:MAG TPA: hypothetical protein VIQ99_03730, partial [Gammaproteobacteria bacterium]
MAHRDLHDRHGFAALDVGSGLERAQRGGCEIEVHVRDGPEAAALDEHGLLVEHLRGLQHLTGRGEHRRAREAELHEPQAHHAIVDVPKLVTRKVDQVDLDAIRAQAVEQRLHETIGLGVQKAGAVDQIHADDAERLLLRCVVEIEHADVHEDAMARTAGNRLELDSHPAVAFVVAAKAAGRDGVREREELRFVAAPAGQPLEVQ